MGEEGSIFDHAQKELKKKSSEPAKVPEEKKEKPPVKTDISDQEIRLMFEQVYKLNDQVAKQLDDAYELMGVSHREIKDYLENPGNFPDTEEWKKVQAARSNLLGRLEKTIIFGGKEPTKKETLELEKKKKEESSGDKKRKGKTLGSRKGWISM